MQRYARSLHGSARPRPCFGDKFDRSGCDRAWRRALGDFCTLRRRSPIVDPVHLLGSHCDPPPAARSRCLQRRARRRMVVAAGVRVVETLCRVFGTVVANAAGPLGRGEDHRGAIAPRAHDLRPDHLGARGVRCGRAVTCIVAAARARDASKRQSARRAASSVEFGSALQQRDKGI